MTSFFSTDSGPLNVLINEMAGTGKSISTISSTLPTCNIEAAVAVLELETLSRPAYLRALRKLHMQGIARMEEILWRRSAHLCIFKRCRPNCLLARPCAVSTTRSARLLTGRWDAGQRFLNLMHNHPTLALLLIGQQHDRLREQRTSGTCCY